MGCDWRCMLARCTPPQALMDALQGHPQADTMAPLCLIGQLLKKKLLALVKEGFEIDKYLKSLFHKRWQLLFLVLPV